MLSNNSSEATAIMPVGLRQSFWAGAGSGERRGFREAGAKTPAETGE
jgi:hypothetical protein